MPVQVKISDAQGTVLISHDHVGDDWGDACVGAQEALRAKMQEGALRGNSANPPQPLSVRWNRTNA